MPELPEVETTRQDLHQLILGQGIVAVDCSGKAMRLPWPADMAARLVGRRLVNTGRRAKYLLLYTDDDQVLAIHLGMSGRMVLSQLAEEEVAPHSHLRLPWPTVWWSACKIPVVLARSA